MRKFILFLFLSVFALSAKSQYLEGLLINPNQSKSKQYIGVSVNGKGLLTNQSRPLKQYETKGHYNGVLLTDFADAIGDYLDFNGASVSQDYVDTTFVTLEQMNDSIAASGGGTNLYISDGVVETDRTIDVDGHFFKIENNGDEFFSIDPENTLYGLGDLDGSNHGTKIIIDDDNDLIEFTVDGYIVKNVGSKIYSEEGVDLGDLTNPFDYLHVSGINLSGVDIGLGTGFIIMPHGSAIEWPNQTNDGPGASIGGNSQGDIDIIDAVGNGFGTVAVEALPQLQFFVGGVVSENMMLLDNVAGTLIKSVTGSGLPINLAPDGALKINGTSGASGSFVAQSGETITVTKGLITAITPP